MLQVAEVIETKKAFKPDQKDDIGDPLPLGSIQCRLGSHQNMVGQVRNIWARPLGFNRRVPLIGEHVILMNGPVNDNTSKVFKTTGYYYFSPINSTDDLVFHHFPKLWERSNQPGGGGAGSTLADKEIPGYTFPKNPKKVENLQIFEGDDVLEGRFGQSIRFGTTVKGDLSVYSKRPTWEGTENTNPIMIMRVVKPKLPGNRPKTSGNKTSSNNKYTIENIKSDDSSIYLTTDQKLTTTQLGFSKHLVAKLIPSYNKPQALINSGRVVINAKDDILFLVGNSKTVVTAKKVQFQSQNYNVDLDDLMDWLKAFSGELQKLTSGQAQFSTAAGPTATATNAAQMIKIAKTDFPLKFKKP